MRIGTRRKQKRTKTKREREREGKVRRAKRVQREMKWFGNAVNLRKVKTRESLQKRAK